MVAVLAAAAAIVVSVSFQLMDTDFWQHLLVGKAIAELHRVPQSHLWTWANYGTPEVLPSWLFRALIWPVWQLGGVPALFVWRWVTTLAAFALAWAAARRMGARGFTPLVVLVWCALVYRHRSQIRPETLAAVLMAAEIWILEMRRSATRGVAGLDPAWWLIPVAWVWANAHISYFLFFVILLFHIVDTTMRAWRGRRLADEGDRANTGTAERRLWLVGALCLAAAFLNPFGWRALWQPFDFLLRMRSEPMFRGIGEMQPLGWANNRANGLFVMMALWPALLIWRARRRGLDAVETLMCVFFTAYMASSTRFTGSYAIVSATYLARDLDEWVRSRHWPAWTAAPRWRAALAAMAMAIIGAAEWSRADRPLSVSVDMTRFPVHACDFMAAHGVRGHGFSQTRVAGYQLWRFWPDRARLPFMDIHQSGTSEDRTLYTLAISSGDGWADLDGRHHFDYVVLDPYMADTLLDALDADTTMRLVFLDDTGVLYVRRVGALAAVADSFGYRLLGGGARRNAALTSAIHSDLLQRRNVIAEIERQAASSPLNARASLALAGLFIESGALDSARARIERALAVDPRIPQAHRRLGVIELSERQPMRAVTEFERERAVAGDEPGLELALGTAWDLAGDPVNARLHFQREARRDPSSPEAHAALEALSRLR